ncbi:rhodanese-like domain-containing protein [Photobacterium sp. J15]|uniref:rhodanese-like domain-containing protein n=1 Tax=Photobacterium sp. J15 TaxID=265901 RepID=UPI0007E41BA0|nr:rhodanese-like domain-containing protein [Photobacterium sp. J15]
MLKNRLLMLSSVAIFSYPAMSASFNDLAELSSSDYQVIDCRSSNHYNGWPEADKSRGGHYPGAFNIDADWLDSLNTDDFATLLDKHGIQMDKSTFLYCEADKAQQLQQRLAQAGMKNIGLIEEDVTAYKGELEALENYQQLVPASWLKQLVDGQEVSFSPDKGYAIVEVAYGPPTKYLVSHIPSAQYLNTNDIESEPLWNKVDDKKLAETIRNLGIRFDTTVILYGRDNIPAARAANILMYAGVKDVRLLNGGWTAWVDAGYQTEPMRNHAEPVDFGKQIPANPQYIIDVPEARDILADPEHKSLVSIRTWDEYIGKISGYTYIKPKGRIVGSKWGHAGSDSLHLEDFRNPDQTMVSPSVMMRYWQPWGINKDQKVSFYCGTGWRASETFFYTYVMGWKDISVFDGGWYEWSGDPANPTATGEPKKNI